MEQTIQRGNGATGTPIWRDSSNQFVCDPWDSAPRGGVRNRDTCGPRIDRAERRSRSSAISVAWAAGQSSRPMTITDRFGRSTSEPMPKVVRAWLGRTSPTSDFLMWLERLMRSPPRPPSGVASGSPGRSPRRGRRR